MRESLRRLPPAYVRGSYPERSQESLPLPARNEQEQPLPFRQNDENEEDDLPPYSKSDPLADETSPAEAGTESIHPHRTTTWSNNSPFWTPDRTGEEGDEENSNDQTRYERDVINHLWREAQQTNHEEEERNRSRTSFERRERRVAPPHDFQQNEPVLDSYASNVETTQSPRRRKRQICCECSKLCWAWWMFWALVNIIPAIVAAVKTF